MKPERWQQLDELFHAALQHEPEERAAFLDEACVDDEALRQQVEALLAANEEAGSFIESPAREVEARGVAADQGSAEAGMASGETISHYRIISPLGSGGMGEVYLTQDTVLGRTVALKLLPASLTQDTDRLRRFEQEARAASGLNHPNIITIYEIGHEGSYHFIAQEYVEGVTLSTYLGNKPLALNEALEIALQVTSALAAAHAKGIVHRDIKPENIMVDKSTHLGRPNQVKVLDFFSDLRDLHEQAQEIQSNVGRAVPPAFDEEYASQTRAVTVQESAVTTREVPARPTSSAEYIVGKIKRHRVAAIIALTVLVI